MGPTPADQTPTSPPAQEPALDRGDTCALDAEWPGAVSAWAEALATEDRTRARARLTWLVRQDAIETDARPNRWWQGPIAIGFVAVVVGTVLVLVAEEQSQRISNVLAVVAWLLYVIGVGCGLVYAYRYRPRRPMSDGELVGAARAVAIAVENGSGTIEAGFDSSS